MCEPGVEFIKREFVFYMDQYQHAAGHANCQSGDTDEGRCFIPFQVPESHFEIVPKQVWFVLFSRRLEA
jgi:hypothetical protein